MTKTALTASEWDFKILEISVLDLFRISIWSIATRH